MTRLINRKILEIFLESMNGKRYITSDAKPEFFLSDLVGKTIIAHKRIKNPRLYNSEVQSPNPRYFDVLELSDKRNTSLLLFEYWGDGACGHLNSYYFDGKRVRFSDDLFRNLHLDLSKLFKN